MLLSCICFLHNKPVKKKRKSPFSFPHSQIHNRAQICAYLIHISHTWCDWKWLWLCCFFSGHWQVCPHISEGDILLQPPCSCPGFSNKKKTKKVNACWCGCTFLSSWIHWWTANYSANLVLEEVLRLGAAVTPFPVPVTVFNFPCELLKEGVGWSWLSVLPSPLLVLSASEDQ